MRIFPFILDASQFVESDDGYAAFLRRGKNALEPFGLHVNALRVWGYAVRSQNEHLVALRAAAFVVAVSMGELRLLALWKRPETLGILLVRNVPHELTRLELRRHELSVRLLDELQVKKPILHFDRVVFGRREPVGAPSPEIGAVAPLRRIQPVAVKLVVPDELEFLSRREKRGLLKLYEIRHVFPSKQESPPIE